MVIKHSLAATAILAILATSQAAAAEFSWTIDRFGGLNDTDSPATLPPGSAQDALNVEANLDGTAIIKRRGYSREATLTVATAPVTGSFSFTVDVGDNLVVVCHDRYCSKSVNGGAFSNFLSTAGGSGAVPTRWSFVSVDGDLFGANDRRDPIFKYDGTTLSYPSGPPQGSLLALTADRMVVADQSANPNRVNYSASANYTNFTVSSLSGDPWNDDLGSPGDRITGLVCDSGRCWIFKRTSITACLIGDQYTTRCQVMSSVIGTQDPQSIIATPAGIFFRAQDRTYWRISDAGLEPLSQKVGRFVRSQNTGSQRSNTQTTQADWQAGSASPPGGWNTVSVAGSVFPSSSSVLDTTQADFGAGALTAISTSDVAGSIILSSVTATDNFADGDFDSGPTTWTVTNGAFSVQSANVKKYLHNDSSAKGVIFTTKVPISSGSWKWTYQFPGGLASCGNADECWEYKFVKRGDGDYYSIQVRPLSSTEQDAIFQIRQKLSGTESVLSSVITGASGAPSLFSPNTDYRFEVQRATVGAAIYLFINDVNVASAAAVSITSSTNQEIVANFTQRPHRFTNIQWFHYRSSGNFVSRVLDTTFSTPVAGPFSSTCTPQGAGSVDAAISFYVRQSTSPNNDMWGALTATSDTLRPILTRRYWQYQAIFTTQVATKTPSCSDISLTATTTGEFRTQCVQPGPNINSWGTLNCAETLVGIGSLTYYSTSAVSCAALPSSLPTAWTQETNNAVLTISTNAAMYVGFRSLLGSATDQAQADACTANWVEGAAAPPVYGVYDSIGNAIYWTTAVDNSTFTNRTIKFDLNLGEWFPFDLTARAPLVTNNVLYFGSSNGGYWNKYAGTGIDSDAGTAINAFWKSKDFGGPSPFEESRFSRISMVARNQGSGSLTSTWTTSGGASDSYAVSLSTTSTIPYARSAHNMRLASPANFINVKIGNNAASQPFEVLGLRIEGASQPWRPLNP